MKPFLPALLASALLLPATLPGSAAAADVRCCNIPERQWVKVPPVMPPAQCLARPNHAPQGTPGAAACARGLRPTPPPPPPVQRCCYYDNGKTLWGNVTAGGLACDAGGGNSSGTFGFNAQDPRCGPPPQPPRKPVTTYPGGAPRVLTPPGHPPR